MMLVQLQEAFYLTDRVMTLSFHKFGNQFFPGTGKDFTPLVQGLKCNLVVSCYDIRLVVPVYILAGTSYRLLGWNSLYATVHCRYCTVS